MGSDLMGRGLIEKGFEVEGMWMVFGRYIEGMWILEDKDLICWYDRLGWKGEGRVI
jgi:hypothetical protein